jgi:hypothetical protein
MLLAALALGAPQQEVKDQDEAAEEQQVDETGIRGAPASAA